MDKETYEALKRVLEILDFSGLDNEQLDSDVFKLKDWIDEVAKEYEEDEEMQQAIQETDDYWRENRHK